jgi:hypothetical protein
MAPELFGNKMKSKRVHALLTRLKQKWVPRAFEILISAFFTIQPLRSQQLQQFTISIYRLRSPRILDSRPDSHLITSSTLIKRASSGTKRAISKSPM